MISIEQFGPMLLSWAKSLHRPMPWRGEKNPYYIWLAEIILQQTRVEQGRKYFEAFKKAYPSIKDLANAEEDEVMKKWEGLGYYSRARNLHATAKFISRKYDGIFPDRFEDILALKGVGPYTAAAIASFAFNLPHAVVDGNVYRVLSRLFAIKTPIDSTAGKKAFAQLAQQLLIKDQPGIYNQAIMDFGATVCLPKKPRCQTCPFVAECRAYHNQQVLDFPVKDKKLTKKERFFHYLVINYQNSTVLRKRTHKDIWHNLYEFPLIELSKIDIQPSELTSHSAFQELIGPGFTLTNRSKTYSQTLSHQKIIACFWEFELDNSPVLALYQEVPKSDIRKFAFPKIIDCYLKDNSLTLKLF